MKINENIGNYHFFKRRQKFFIYDFLNNLILVSKEEENYLRMKRVLTDLSENKILSSVIYEKYKTILDNFKIDNSIFNSNEYINESTISSTKMTMMIAQTCNLRCSYCYGSEGRFGTNGEFMTKETAEQAIRYLVKRAPSDANSFFITFFGGEPLLNYALMKHTMEFAKRNFPGKEFAYTFTTNATLFTQEIIDYLKKNDISILISLDGWEKIHNTNRIFHNGKGSFARVMKSIELLKKNNMPFSIRATMAHEFFKYYEDVIDFFTAIGAFKIYIARLQNYNVDSPNFDIDIEKLKKDGYYVDIYSEKIESKILNGENPKVIPFTNALMRIHEASSTLISCGAMNGSTAVAHNGNLYPCHRFVGIKGFNFGNVYSGIDNETLQTINNNLDKATFKCNSCWCKYICQRGCIRDIAKNKGTFISHDDKYCQLQRDSIERALETYYSIIKYRPEFIKELSEKEIEIYNIV
jgi:uncharacterized protein